MRFSFSCWASPSIHPSPWESKGSCDGCVIEIIKWIAGIYDPLFKYPGWKSQMMWWWPNKDLVIICCEFDMNKAMLGVENTFNFIYDSYPLDQIHNRYE